jgi:hypothetical protein
LIKIIEAQRVGLGEQPVKNGPTCNHNDSISHRNTRLSRAYTGSGETGCYRPMNMPARRATCGIRACARCNLQGRQLHADARSNNSTARPSRVGRATIVRSAPGSSPAPATSAALRLNAPSSTSRCKAAYRHRAGAHSAAKVARSSAARRAGNVHQRGRRRIF